MGNHAGQLRAHGDQEGFLALVELAPLFLLNDQNAHHPSMVNDRHAEERGVALFSGLGEIAESGMRRGIFQIDRLLAGTDIADQTFVGSQADDTHRALVQTFGGHQHVAGRVGIKQIHRAHFGAHGATHALHDNVQGASQIPCGIDLLNDAAQRSEHAQHSVSSPRGRRGASSFIARR